MESLSKRENEVLALIMQGADNHAIAERLCITPHTAKNHASTIFRKFKVRGRYQLVVKIFNGRNGVSNG